MSENKKQKKTFKEYYDESQEFKKKHTEYVLTKVECKYCGSITARCNMPKHQRTNKCITAKTKKENEQKTEKQKELENALQVALKIIQQHNIQI